MVTTSFMFLNFFITISLIYFLMLILYVICFILFICQNKENTQHINKEKPCYEYFNDFPQKILMASFENISEFRIF